MPDISIPQARRIVVDTTGAQIVEEASPATRDSRGIYLPHYIEPVSHIAIDIGGSLAKVVYFTRTSLPLSHSPTSGPSSPFLHPHPPQPLTSSTASSSTGTATSTSTISPHHETEHTTIPTSSSTDTCQRPKVNGALTPQNLTPKRRFTHSRPHASSRRSSLPPPLPGGLLNFARFETEHIDDLISFLQDLISSSAKANHVSLEKMRSTVKVMATGGGAHMYYSRLTSELGVEVRREEEMECLLLGLAFVTRVPEEVFWFSEELVYKVSHSVNLGKKIQDGELPRPSPSPPTYQVTFAPTPKEDEETPHFPCLIVNIGSGVSIVKVDEDGGFERVSGTSLGGGTLWGLLSLLTDARSFDDMLALSEQGDNSGVDMLVGDIYGSDYSKIGLKSSTIASTFGKVFRKGTSREERMKKFSQADIARSLLYAISNNIGHVAYMNAAKYNLDRVFFGGCFIRGHAATISTLSYAIRFWSKGTMRACFLRHEGFLGSIGAWIKNVEIPQEPTEKANGHGKDQHE
ncbi:hypothetical protein TREMEDRAFT_40740 [Tremella mesenterica DSM 1558]|uniref:uncharacterized protein n=1 Tax=Tremella mesenterica (strain ATCC 24925 / CBS 8224 / DSM 1558 / NBRC 9311 / NRRL Y-6157 / RJB 2259-6 / UBC 559-6) TaxID=578456 RepID=UPI00032BE8CC|nr:uncharacterized protein TREMEDRAFT_40740 [Tremella mesenterica DSM 1558]EIW66732.1 hypothetical protein TREMEDRAFT_40740 [Tremella mesenterica DSM 1558]